MSSVWVWRSAAQRRRKSIVCNFARVWKWWSRWSVWRLYWRLFDIKISWYCVLIVQISSIYFYITLLGSTKNVCVIISVHVLKTLARQTVEHLAMTSVCILLCDNNFWWKWVTVFLGWVEFIVWSVFCIKLSILVLALSMLNIVAYGRWQCWHSKHVCQCEEEKFCLSLNCHITKHNNSC